jgi:hypothetical protein
VTQDPAKAVQAPCPRRVQASAQYSYGQSSNWVPFASPNPLAAPRYQTVHSWNQAGEVILSKHPREVGAGGGGGRARGSQV